MKKILFLVVIATIVISCNNKKISEQDNLLINESYYLGDKLLSTERLNLVWADEFNVDGMVNPKNWTYEKGFVRNQEIQYYTENRPENCRVEDGHLIITGRKENKQYADTTSFSDGTYTSASIMTNKKHSWKYGRFEIRAKVPSGQGPWPAFWAKGINQNEGIGWPTCGEIDIMEYSAQGPEMIHNAIWGESSSNPSSEPIRLQKDYSDDFYIYSLDWNENRLVFAIDNIVTHVVDISDISHNPFRQEFFILINLALGASTDRTLGGKLDPSCLPLEYIVDYVRIYQH